MIVYERFILMKEQLYFQATGVEAYRQHLDEHPTASILSHIAAGLDQVMSPAENITARKIEKEQYRISVISDPLEQSQRLHELTSSIVRPQYWRNAKLIDGISHILVASVISIAVLSTHLSFMEIVAAAVLTKVLVNSAVIKLQTRS